MKRILLIILLLVSFRVYPNVSAYTDTEVPEEYSKKMLKQEEAVVDYNEILKWLEFNSEEEVAKSYAGAFIDSNDRIVILVNKDDKEIKDVIKEITSNNLINIKKVKYSLIELNDFKEIINNNVNILYDLGVQISTVEIDVESNEILVSFFDITESKIKLAKKIFGDMPVTFKNTDIVKEEVVNIKAGQGLKKHPLLQPNTQGTIAFTAIRNGVEGFVMTGHGEPVNSKIYLVGTSTHIGTIKVRVESQTTDASFVEASSSANITDDTINGKNVIGGTSVLTGTTVCKIGDTTGVTCGTVTNTSIDLWADDGSGNLYLKYADTLAANYLSAPGDSGAGVFYEIVTGYLVVSVHRAGPQGGGPGTRYSSKWSNVSADLDVSVY